MNVKPLGALLLITAVFADSRYSWGKYKSIVRDDGLRKGTPLQQDGMQDDQHDAAIPAEQKENASNADPKMEATTVAEASPDSDASPEVAAATAPAAANESKPSTSAADFVETGEAGTAPTEQPASPGASGNASRGGDGPVLGDTNYPFIKQGDDANYIMKRLDESQQRVVDDAFKNGKIKIGNNAVDGDYGGPGENFIKSNQYFKEIVEDTKNLAKATDLIQLELKEHKKALDDFKAKQAATKTEYDKQMETVKTGFGQVKEFAAKEAGEPTAPHNAPEDGNPMADKVEKLKLLDDFTKDLAGVDIDGKIEEGDQGENTYGGTSAPAKTAVGQGGTGGGEAAQETK